MLCPPGAHEAPRSPSWRQARSCCRLFLVVATTGCPAHQWRLQSRRVPRPSCGQRNRTSRQARSPTDSKPPEPAWATTPDLTSRPPSTLQARSPSQRQWSTPVPISFVLTPTGHSLQSSPQKVSAAQPIYACRSQPASTARLLPSRDSRSTSTIRSVLSASSCRTRPVRCRTSRSGPLPTWPTALPSTWT